MVDASIWDEEIEVSEDVISFVDNHVFASEQFGFLTRLDRLRFSSCRFCYHLNLLKD
jgi:hypothetical protein